MTKPLSKIRHNNVFDRMRRRCCGLRVARFRIRVLYLRSPRT